MGLCEVGFVLLTFVTEVDIIGDEYLEEKRDAKRGNKWKTDG